MSRHQTSYSTIRTTDYDHDGTPDAVYRIDYGYVKGDLVYALQADDWQNDGTIDETYLNTYQYDEHGNHAGSITKVDWNGDGAFDASYSSILTYTEKGLLSEERYDWDWDNNGAPDQTQIVQHTYDKSGNRTSTLYTSQPDGYQDLTTYGHDKQGNVVLEERDYGNNGSIDYSMVRTGLGGDSYRETQTQDWTGDGVADAIYRFDYIYDGGNLVRVYSEYDHDANGTVDYRAWTDSTYNKKGLVTFSESGSDWDGDGVANDRWTQETTYTKKGLVERRIDEWDYGNDGVMDGRTITDYTYDRHGQVLSELRTYDGAGTADRVDYAYDKSGLLIYEAWDWGADGTYEEVMNAQPFDYPVA